MSGDHITHGKHLPSCGKCGYPVVGLQSNECPECGADLREVGILRSSGTSGINDKIIVSLIYTVVFIAAVTFAWHHVEQMLPSTVRHNARLKLRPNTNNYDALVKIETKQTLWGGQASSGSIGFNTAGQSYPPTTPLQVTLMGQIAKTQTTSIILYMDTAVKPPQGPVQPFLSIDPITRHAEWYGYQNQSNQTQSPATANDFLDFLASVGEDRNNPNTIIEADQLYQFLDGLAQNQSQFSLARFSTFGGGGGTGHRGPSHWFEKGYILLMISIWTLGMVFIIRRRRRELYKPTDPVPPDST